jgi:hypothetical protein
MARKDDTSQDVSVEPDPREGAPDPRTHNPDPPVMARDYRVSMPGPLEGTQIPLSEVRAATRSSLRGNSGVSKGQYCHASGPYLVRMSSPLRRRPDAATWLVAHDISLRAKPDVRPLGRTVSAFIAERTRRLSTLLTGDVPSQHLMRPVHSAGRRRQGHPTDDAPVQSVVEQYACAVRRTMLIIPCTRSFPCTPVLRSSWMSGHKKIAPTTNISRSKYYLRYVSGPTCWGSTLLYMPPLAIKWEACNVTRGRLKLPWTKLRLSTLKLPQQFNTQWSRVLRSGGPNHSKSSLVHVLDVRLAGQAKRLSPFLILGFRAGAIRHPAGEFPLRHKQSIMFI